MIDLRSDTVSQPTAPMREALANAPVGDDVYGDDPSVNRLQEVAAERLGKPAALFVSSGTQSNLLALLSHCQRGDEYIAGQTAHAYRFEGGGGAVLGGLQPQPLAMSQDGQLNLEEVELAVKPIDPHFARTRLLCLENTHGGVVVSQSYVLAARALCDRYGLAMHLDGARLFNAAVASSVTVAELAAPFDSVSICLSKGLGAPVGSLLLGSAGLIDSARRWRKVLGGGMRQAGVLAAAGLYALSHHVERLQQDHEHAKQIGDLLNRWRPGCAWSATNMVFLGIETEELARLQALLGAADVRIRGPRWVFHLGVDAAKFAQLKRVLEACLAQLQKPTTAIA